jgi:thiamine biosynthesis lipoprotein
VAVGGGGSAPSAGGGRRGGAPHGRAVHHLLDPRTGEPARPGLLAVTVSGPDPAWAEVWTKALFLGGRRTIGDEARGRDLAAWWVDEGGSLSMTPAGRALSAWVAETRMG